MGEERKYFELIFQGPVDGTAKTLQTLKGAFVADLEFPVDEVRRFLTEAPLTILQSESESKVTTCYERLKAAGAKVLLVRPQATDLPPKEESPEVEIDLEMTFGEPQQDSPDDKPQAEKVESSSNNLQLDIDDILFNSGTESAVEEVKTHVIPEPNAVDNEQLFPNLKQPESEVVKETKATTEGTSVPNLALLDDIDESLEKPVLPTATPVVAEAPKPAQQNGAKVLEVSQTTELTLELDTTPIVKPDPKKKEASAQTDVAKNAAIKSEFDLTLASVVEEPEAIEPKYVDPVESIPPPAAEEEDDLTIKSVDAPPPATDPLPEKKEVVAEPEKHPEAPAKEETLRERMARRAQEPQSNEGTADETEIGSDEADEEEYVSPNAKRQFILREILPLAGFCAVLLILGNVVYFMFLTDSEDEVAYIEKQVTQVLSHIPKRDKKVVEKAPIIPIVELNFTSEHDGRNFSLVLETKGKDVSGARGQLITPPPPSLSPEEIVRGTALAPWLYNMELSSAEFTKNEAGIFQGIGSTKSYIEYKGTRARITGKALISTNFDSDMKTAKGEIIFFAGFEANIHMPEELTSVPGPGRFRYLYRETFDIQPKPIDSTAQVAPSAAPAASPGK